MIARKLAPKRAIDLVVKAALLRVLARCSGFFYDSAELEAGIELVQCGGVKLRDPGKGLG